MKQIILAVIVMCFGIAAYADGDPGGVTDLIAQKAKEAKAATTLGLRDGKIGGALYLPIWTFHSMPAADGSKDDFVEINVGGEMRQSEKTEAIFFPAVNPVALSGRLWASQWAKDHLTRSIFPPVFVGLGPAVPLNYDRLRLYHWADLVDSLRLTVSVRLGGLKL